MTESTQEKPAHDTPWKATVLWGTLQRATGRDAEDARLVLERHMPTIQAVLRKGGTARPDFTLHDDDHGLRVATRMGEIIPPDVRPHLSPYELTLLLLSAYLHDIGMTPELDRVERHYRYLVSGKPDRLTDEEIREVQAWLDSDERRIEPPVLREETSTDAALELASELTTYYCRHKHNDWSEAWIREHLTATSLGTYAAWIDDLVVLCRSHHDGYEELRNRRFDPKFTGASSLSVHLRYLACVLRVADILEFDPERTPEVIFRHRSIPTKSQIYWWKDQGITFKPISYDDGPPKLIMTARPTNAQIHRAIQLTVEDVNRELSTCRRLAEWRDFSFYMGSASKLPHRWDMPLAVIDDIQPLADEYEYIDGSFRPNIKKILRLISGIKLYGNPLVAVRELLQNAFDAVREEIARRRLSDAGEPEQVDALRKMLSVELRVEQRADNRLYLICRDQGVGMTKAIIRDRLLVSGTSRGRDLIDLERQCRKRGFSVEYTGQFGIGVLSYLMLADRVVLRTQRSQRTPDPPEGGWEFETEGLGSFGELRRLARRMEHGTEVELRLRRDVAGADPAAWPLTLEKYLKQTLLSIPCRLKLTGIDGQVLRDINPGWVIDEVALADKALEAMQRDRRHFEQTPEDWLPTREREEIQLEDRRWDQHRHVARERLRWHKREIPLPHNLGRAYIAVPYFDLVDGIALGFLLSGRNNGEYRLEKFGRGY